MYILQVYISFFKKYKVVVYENKLWQKLLQIKFIRTLFWP